MARKRPDTKNLDFYDLSHPWGLGVPNWPYFEDVKIERVHYHAKSRVLSQRLTIVMHSGTHTDAPAHVIEDTPFIVIGEIPLDRFFGSRIPIGRLGEPDDLVGILSYLVSPASDFCTGQVVYVDGGYTAG